MKLISKVKVIECYVGFRSQVRRTLKGCQNLYEAEIALMKEFPGWFVYHGGNHVALHAASGSPRVALIGGKWF